MKKSAATQFTEEELEADVGRPPHSALNDVDDLQMLRARIDEQSGLIMILKQRADDAVSRANLLEQRNDERTDQITNLSSRLDGEGKKFSMLETRFFELASNHEEMIKIKDEYKASNERLRTENIQLRRDNEQLFSKQLNLLTEECESMRRCNEAITREAKHLDQQNRKLEAMLKEAVESREREKHELLKNYGDRNALLEEELKSLREKSRGLGHDAEDLKAKLASMERLHTAEKEKLAKEKDELLTLVMERGRIIQDKQAENKTLMIQSGDLQRQLQSARQRFQDEAERVDADTRVQRVKDQLARLQYKYDSLSKAHEAFKRHTGSLLDNERQINNQLADVYTTASQYSMPIMNTPKSQISFPNINTANNLIGGIISSERK